MVYSHIILTLKGGIIIFSLYRQLITRTRVLFLVTSLFVAPLILGSCKANPNSETIFLPVATATMTQYPLALARGRLVLDDNCLRLKSFYFFGSSYLLIWPYGYSLSTQGNKISVLDTEGEIVTQVGNWVQVGGGYVSLEIAEKYVGEPIPDIYRGPYFIIAGVVND